MKCPRCQYETSLGDNFCSKCGHALAHSLGGPQQAPPSYADLQHAMTEALAREIATGEILRIISRSPIDVQAVFDAIAESSARLCEASDAQIWRRDDDRLFPAAHYGPIAVLPTNEFLLPLVRGTISGRSVLEGRTVQVVDIQTEAAEYPEGSALARQLGYRTILSVPLKRGRDAIGAIVLRRTEAQLFSARQIALLETFADQAVIAIENVRLFNETKEALERQTATAEILRIIANSPTDIQPVLEAAVQNAARLCGTSNVSLYQVEGSRVRKAAEHGLPLTSLSVGDTRPLSRTTVSGRVILDGATIHLADHQSADALREYPDARRDTGIRTTIGVPLLREGVAIGAFTAYRTESRPFAEREIALLKTFADQAAIAIENVRLFTELQEKNRALTEAHAQVSEALDQQTATGEILRVISSSPTDVQPVFDAIAESAVQLCDARYGAVYRFDGDLVHFAAHHNFSAFWLERVREEYPLRPARNRITGRAILSGSVVQIPDVELDSEYGSPWATHHGFRSLLAVPILRDGAPIGCIVIYRPEPGAFAEKHIALLKTFADQAVIAIENVRLFNETKDALERQTATAEILRVISSSLTDLQPVFDTIAENAARLCGATDATVRRIEGNALRLVARCGSIPFAAPDVIPISREYPMGLSVIEGRTIHIEDILPRLETEFPRISRELRTILVTPLLREGTPIGAIVIRRAEVRPFTDAQIALLKTFADQAVIAIENVRLFNELEAANRELAAASQHKSEFLANMSHELRTPLNAIIGFSEVLTDRMFGEVNEKQEEYLKDINASGGHLLSLINDILDLSKIEAGRMELELTEFHLPTAIENALMLVRERAGRRSLTLQIDIDDRLGQIQGDERKIRQVVLNLLSNAIKFTAEGGRIEVGAVPRDGFVEVSVNDTGIGIAPEDQGKVFEEFRQVGTAAKKIEGTGLGLTLCRKFVELHGGRIWVKSQVGEGSTFTFTIPARLSA